MPKKKKKRRLSLLNKNPENLLADLKYKRKGGMVIQTYINTKQNKRHL
jgi:hypothetical protein